MGEEAPILAGRPADDKRRCRVFLVDDSAVARLIVHRLVKETGRFDVVGQAASADEALTVLARMPVDVILLDVEMPGTNGIDAIPLLLQLSKGAAIVMLSAHCHENAEASVRAMALGATETLLKPNGRFVGDFATELALVLDTIAAERIHDRAAHDAVADPQVELHENAIFEHPVQCLAIGASTGGVHALLQFMAALPAEIDPPILITQHLPDEFVPIFAAQLAKAVNRQVEVAEDGRPLANSRVLIAPGDAHIGFARDPRGVAIRLDRSRASSGCLPSVDPMLTTLGEVYGPSGVGVILSGMGRDGSIGAARLAEDGGEVLVQDRSSSVIWGMPGAAIEAGAAHYMGHPAALAARVMTRARSFGWR